ncbi:MAG TPA: cyclic nucleotide-binding domain-containing protein [Chthoniobacterales bacterium]|nr:cyclic nucleotide-binding domain-containing protein [Chthoniobacterales bacterium]
MQNYDFFAFCTSLKRPELKAIGELSWVRHMARGEVLYHPGELGNALYIVNRGSLEVLPPKGSASSQIMRLSRGDVIGDVETFSDSPRTRTVRSAEDETSLQCFPRANFDELLRRVPSFYHYLCGHMAARLMQAHDLPLQQSHGLELSGRISTFDLTTIHQTVVNSGQTGELQIKDENAETMGAFYFETGRLSAGQFQHLTGIEAFWQLFLIDAISGTFSFSAAEKPLTDSVQSTRIDSTGSDLLIVALQYRDEFNALKAQMPSTATKLKPVTATMRWNGEAPDQLSQLAHKIWDVISKRPLTLSELYRHCSMCEFKIYQVIHELLKSKQVITADQTVTPVPPPPRPVMQPSLQEPMAFIDKLGKD